MKLKKIIIVLVTLIVGSAVLFSLIACEKKPADSVQPRKSLFEYETIEPLNKDKENEILTLCYEKYVREEYPEQTVADLKIDYNMGNRNGNYVFIFSDAREYDNDPYKHEYEVVKTYMQRFMSKSHEINVGYEHKDGRPMHVYNNGAVYGFAEAFKNGILSEEDMEYFLQCRWFVTEEERMQKRMSRTLENEIMECYITTECNDPDYYCCKYFAVIKYYLGIYNECTIVGMSEGLQADTTSMENITIDNIAILQNTSNPLMAYKDNRLYLLEDAYNAGLITKEDLILIAEKANSKELPIYNNHYLLNG